MRARCRRKTWSCSARSIGSAQEWQRWQGQWLAATGHHTSGTVPTACRHLAAPHLSDRDRAAAGEPGCPPALSDRRGLPGLAACAGAPAQITKRGDLRRGPRALQTWNEGPCSSCSSARAPGATFVSPSSGTSARCSMPGSTSRRESCRLPARPSEQGSQAPVPSPSSSRLPPAAPAGLSAGQPGAASPLSRAAASPSSQGWHTSCSMVVRAACAAVSGEVLHRSTYMHLDPN